MSGWISSKIKAAESLLQQIDQQAAESLGKSDRLNSPSDLSSNIPFSQTNTPFSQTNTPFSQTNTPFSQTNTPFPQNDVSEPFRDLNPKTINLPKKKPYFSQLPPQKPLIGTGTGTSTSSVSLSTKETLDADWTELLNSPPKPIKKNNIKPPSVIKREKETRIEPNESKDGKKELNYYESESGSDSDSDDSSYDSEEERERARKAIEEREELVERLRREKESLERILLEREKEQVQLVRELQVNTSEAIEAVEMEKKKHNSTRIEALARVAQLEGVNAELSKVLATTQWNLEIEANRVADLREQIDFKEAARKEYRRKMNKIQSSSALGDEIKSLNRFKLEIFDAEYSFISDKITRLKDKAKNIEENIKMVRNEMECHTELETELEKRLDQLSDRLIQKQMQVESLSSEKATLLLRIEMISRFLDNSTQIDSQFDIESLTTHKPRQERQSTGRLQFSSLIRQLDSLFSAGLVFLRRNPNFQILAVLYLFCLHFWVLYVFMDDSRVSEGEDVISLATINRTVSG